MEQNTLFGQEPPRPLAARLRPQCLEEYVGQTHLLGEGKLLRRLIETDQLASMILGAARCGKNHFSPSDCPCHQSRVHCILGCYRRD